MGQGVPLDCTYTEDTGVNHCEPSADKHCIRAICKPFIQQNESVNIDSDQGDGLQNPFVSKQSLTPFRYLSRASPPLVETILDIT